ncbi:hypothetical protein HYR69_04310 [Candidatus Sumerlaeota bacterium]|nr:hypothetical protein [Candidatus Sumerlaeota bacterium]
MKWLRKFYQWIRSLFTEGGAGEFLCDSCKYDYGNACTRPERPNARKCPDYKRRG